MSSENVALVRSIIDVWNDRGEALLEAYHEDAQWDFQGWGFDIRGTFHGAEGLFEMLDAVRAEWVDVRVEAEGYVEKGDKVAFLAHFYARRRNGLEVSDSGTCVFTLRDGKVARFSLFRDPDEASALLEAQEEQARAL